MVPSSMDRDVRSDMSCRGCDMDNLDRVVGNASVDYRDEISVGNGGVGVDDGSWSLVVVCSRFLLSSFIHFLLVDAMRWRWTDGPFSPISLFSFLPIAIATAS